MSRTKMRELAFQLVYSLGFDSVETPKDAPVDEFATQLIEYVTHNTANIDEIIVENVKGFCFDRIYKVDLALLRMAIAEIKYMQTPAPVVIGSVVDLAKKYGTEKSPSFVNGVLAQVSKTA